MIYTGLIKNAWDYLYDPQKDVIETVNKFFHQDYEQCINGIIIHHVIEQKKNMTIESIDYKHIMEKGNELFAFIILGEKI